MRVCYLKRRRNSRMPKLKNPKWIKNSKMQKSKLKRAKFKFTIQMNNWKRV